MEKTTTRPPTARPKQRLDPIAEGGWRDCEVEEPPMPTTHPQRESRANVLILLADHQAHVGVGALRRQSDDPVLCHQRSIRRHKDSVSDSHREGVLGHSQVFPRQSWSPPCAWEADVGRGSLRALPSQPHTAVGDFMSARREGRFHARRTHRTQRFNSQYRASEASGGESEGEEPSKTASTRQAPVITQNLYRDPPSQL